MRFILLLLLNYISFSYCSEKELRNELFNKYDINRRPVLDSNKNVSLKYGVEIKSLKFFDQKAENRWRSGYEGGETIQSK